MNSWKKLVKPLKNSFWDPICNTKGSVWATPKIKNIFFLAEMTKADYQIPETFYFITISYVLAELWIFFYFVCFLSEKGHFQLKQHDNASFFAFFIKLDLIWPRFCLKSQHFLSVDFQWNLLEDSININNFCCNPVFLKKNGKTSKNCFLGHNLHY